MKKIVQEYSGLAIISGLIIILDQVTKAIVRAKLPYGEMWAPWEWLYPYARFVHWKNTGAAFGMLSGFSLVFAALAVVVSLVILYYYPRVSRQEWPLRLALSMQFAGAVGNLIDRIFFNGQVTDFISVGNFAVFNVADASISVGVVILLIWVWWKENKEKSAISQDTSADTASHDEPTNPENTGSMVGVEEPRHE